LVLIQGRFDQDKLMTAADRLAMNKSVEFRVKKLKTTKGVVYGVGEDSYLAVLDRSSLIWVQSKSLLEDVSKKLDAKQSKLINTRLARWVEGLDRNSPVNLIALGDSVVGHRSWSDTIDGQLVKRSEFDTLQAAGIEVVQASLFIGKNLRTKVVV